MADQLTTEERSYYFWLGYEDSADQRRHCAAWIDWIWNLDGRGAEQAILLRWVAST